MFLKIFYLLIHDMNIWCRLVSHFPFFSLTNFNFIFKKLYLALIILPHFFKYCSNSNYILVFLLIFLILFDSLNLFFLAYHFNLKDFFIFDLSYLNLFLII